MNEPRKTLKSTGVLSGIGIHSGEFNTLTLTPAPSGTGIVFEYQGIKIPAIADHSLPPKRATILEYAGVRIMTPEHLLSACFGYGVTDIIIKVSQPEIPILDGSAKPFCDLFDAIGLVLLTEPLPRITVTTPITLSKGNASITALPGSSTRFSIMIEYDQFIGVQWASYDLASGNYATMIAPARTYGFKSEIDALLASGLAKGGAIDNAVIIGDTGYVNPLRFPDELARHKLLDLMGDLALTGAHLQGHFIGLRSGHALNRDLAIELRRLLPV